MRAVVCKAFGPLSDLVIEELPAPLLGPGQVRIAVTAAGVAFVDALLVQGLYQVKPPLPFTPGSELAGTVTEVADDVAGLAVGDRVFAATLIGGMATEVVVPARAAVKVPGTMSDGQAATFAQSYSTAYFALAKRAWLRGGQSLLVLGAGSGVGLAAVDVGRALGLDVLAVASTPAKRELALSRGARAVLDSADPVAVKAWARELSGGGVDAVYDPVGGDLALESLRALKVDGQFLVVGFAAGTIPALPANQILLSNRRVIGVDLGGWLAGHPADSAEITAALTRLVGSGRLDPVEPTAYPLAAAAAALAAQQTRTVAGKVVLVP